MKLGTMVTMDTARLDQEFSDLRQMGFSTCQLICWNEGVFTKENQARILPLIKEHGIEVSALWCGWPGPCEWNNLYGPITIGLVPEAYRHRRLDVLEKCSDFCAGLGVQDMITHVGFLPANPLDETYTGLVGALRHLVRHCRGNGQYFLFETGQETPVTLLRTIEDIGEDNVGINLDPANLIMYGMGNPVDALDVFGRYIRNMHGKDGLYPEHGRELGREVPIGQGKVNFPALIGKLKELQYDRYITIEREISGEQQRKDIQDAKILLEKLWFSQAER